VGALISLLGSLSYGSNLGLNRKAYADFRHEFAHRRKQHDKKPQGPQNNRLFNSSEKRLARALLLLARYGRYGKQPQPHQRLPKISQGALAEMIGTTRSRVNFFMNEFRNLRFIEYNGGLRVNNSLLTVVLHE
jgi:CRP-like cAMP-binding protein